MEKFIINGDQKLTGSVSASGAKNVALKALVAACLTDEEVIIKNIPLISDFMIMVDIIRDLGGKVDIKGHTAFVSTQKIRKTKVSLEKGAKIRTSVMFLAPLLARLGKAVIPNPGGCRIGARPIDRTIKGLKKLGFNVIYNHSDGYFYIEKSKKKEQLGNTTVYRFEKCTHTGTETLILTMTLGAEKTILENAAEEPEIDELINILNKMGANIKRKNRKTIVIIGVPKLHGAEFTIGPDRNEIVTLAVAGVVTKGDIFVKDANIVDLEEFLLKLIEVGGGVEKKSNGIRFYYKDLLKSADVTTSAYPGFMTDWQGPWAVLMTQAIGESVIHETVYESRFGYVRELKKMGASISFFNPKVANPENTYNFNLVDMAPDYFHAIRVKGETRLHNAVVEISDLRAGATLVLAGLAAKGQSVVFGIEHLDRGYEGLENRLNHLGANIRRVRNE